MLNIGKKMLCVYGFKPNHSKDEISWNSRESMSENFLSEGRKKMTVRIRFFPRESQPSSSTRWWDVTLKPKSLFRNKHKVKITESVGTKEFSTNEGKVTFDEENVVVRGQLHDDSIAGRYFVLRLKHPDSREEMYASEDIFYEGTLARSQDPSVSEEGWEITHDAVVFRDQAIEC